MKPETLGEKVLRTRKERALPRDKAANEIGITMTWLAMRERGSGVGETARQKIEAWITKGAAKK